MSIKSVSPNPVAPVESRQKVDGKVKTKASTERDAHGQREQAEPEQKRHLTDEEFSESMKLLKEMPGIAANNLQVRVEQNADVRVIYIEDLKGKLIRRLTEADLWLATHERGKPTGKIFDKAM